MYVSASASTWYVDDSAPEGGNGTSWRTSFRSLQAALAKSGAGDEILIAQGTYVPTPGTDRDASFVMKSGVALRGGYRGAFAGEGDPDDRNTASFPSVLSGGIGSAGIADNSFHVIRFEATTPAAILDGVRVVDGNANGATNADRSGGGISIVGGHAEITDCTIASNQATLEGAGVYVDQATVAFVGCAISTNSGAGLGAGLRAKEATTIVADCSFTGNAVTTAGTGGGGIAVDGGSVAITDSSFAQNSAPVGGALRVFGGDSHTVDGCAFVGNTALKHGGGVASAAALTITNTTFQTNSLNGTGSGNGGGALAVFAPDGPVPAPALRVALCVFSANQATTTGMVPAAGGGIWCQGTATVTSSRFLGNTARNGGGAAAHGNGALRLVSCEFSGNNALVSGGAISVNDSSAYVTNCTLSRNTAVSTGGGVSLAAGAVVAHIRNSILWLNAVGANTGYAAQLSDTAPGVPLLTYCTIQGASSTVGIDVDALDPLFALPLGPDGQAGTLDDDLTLLTGSPAIDAGANAAVSPDAADADQDGDIMEFLPLDAGGRARFADDRRATDRGCGFDSIVDRGSHEHPGVSVAPGRGDANGDHLVNGADLALLLSAWGPASPCDDVDVIHSGSIDASDLLTLLGELWNDQWR